VDVRNRRARQRRENRERAELGRVGAAGGDIVVEASDQQRGGGGVRAAVDVVGLASVLAGLGGVVLPLVEARKGDHARAVEAEEAREAGGELGVSVGWVKGVRRGGGRSEWATQSALEATSAFWAERKGRSEPAIPRSALANSAF